MSEVPLYSKWGVGQASHGARPVHLIIAMIKWIRTSRLSINHSLSGGGAGLDFDGSVRRRCLWRWGAGGSYPPQQGDRERGERYIDNRLRALRPPRPHTLGYVGGCDEEQGVIKCLAGLAADDDFDGYLS